MRARPADLVMLSLAALGIWLIAAGAYIHAKAFVAQYLLNYSWAETLAGRSKAKPWPWADTWPVARLRAPEHQVDLVVLAGANGRTLAFGPGHLDGTPLPGNPGNSVISAHRDTHFRFLKDMRLGDELDVQTADEREHRFRVISMQVVDARHVSLVEDTARSMLTLITCYPFDALVAGGPLRYVVVAEQVPVLAKNGQRLPWPRSD
jgi:sortase A